MISPVMAQTPVTTHEMGLDGQVDTRGPLGKAPT